MVTAYNSVESQTDASPCVGAGGHLCGRKDCVVANNALPLGAKVKVAGLGVCTVLDRMNSRFGADRFDVFFDKDIAAAHAWGVQTREIEILK